MPKFKVQKWQREGDGWKPKVLYELSEQRVRLKDGTIRPFTIKLFCKYTGEQDYEPSEPPAEPEGE